MTTKIKQLLALAHVDPDAAHPQPSSVAVAVATVVAVGGSLAADAVLVALGTRLLPSTKGFPHFRFGDYATLTVVGVVVACAAWPVTTRISSTPRWLFLRMAVVVTLVLWAPDVWILWRGEPPRAVLVLVVMHLAVAVVSYNALVHIAAADTGGGHVSWAAPEGTPARRRDARRGWVGGAALAQSRVAWFAMGGLVALESVLGIACLLVVPAGRPSGWLPPSGSGLYVVHAVAGVVLGAGALVLLAAAVGAKRSVRVSAIIGVAGVVLGAGGGAFSADHDLRLLGIALMFVGAMVALTGYLIAAIGAGLPDAG